jgi:hypothetical protein
LTLIGDHNADELVKEVMKKTGLHLSRDPETGKVTIDKGTNRDKVGSKSLANKVKDIIGGKKTDVSINVEENQEGVMLDSYPQRAFDMADYKAMNADAPAFAAASLGHVLEEFYPSAKPFKWYNDAPHMAGIQFEMEV